MRDTVVTGVRSADEPASQGFRQIGPISALQAVLGSTASTEARSS
jgi:hypothetical protein